MLQNCPLSNLCIMFILEEVKGSRKKKKNLNGRAIKSWLPPSPSSLMTVWTWEHWNVGKKRFQKKFRNGPVLYPPTPHPLARPLREELFCGFPYFHSIKLLLFRIRLWILLALMSVSLVTSYSLNLVLAEGPIQKSFQVKKITRKNIVCITTGKYL